MAGNKLFGVDIAGLVQSNVAPGLLDLTLVKVTPGTRTPGSLTGGTNPTESSTAGKGIAEDYDERQIDGAEVRRGDRRVLIVGNSLSAGSVIPEQGDKITIEGATYEIVRIERDPAAATYTCQVRGG